MTGIVATAIPGAQGFDTDTVISLDKAKLLHDAGFGFCLRYLSRTSPQNSGDLSTSEVSDILSAGLALMPVQHVSRAGWTPNGSLGRAYGTTAVANAIQTGFPVGVSIWLDLEEWLPETPHESVIAYVNEWATIVAVNNFVPGLYVGPDDNPLSGDELYWRLKVRHYWKSASIVPLVSHRGYQMFQYLAPSPVDGIDIDRNVIQSDNFGGLPFWLAPRFVS